MGSAPRGIRTARKLRDHRRVQLGNDKDYGKSHLGTALKANPFGGVEAKQSNSAIRKCVRRFSQLHRRVSDT